MHLVYNPSGKESFSKWQDSLPPILQRNSNFRTTKIMMEAAHSSSFSPATDMRLFQSPNYVFLDKGPCEVLGTIEQERRNQRSILIQILLVNTLFNENGHNNISLF
ncbi:hypothetical protein NPIL_623171 [Nephila pilipes]|uniref:Uncharacterized protein n=1 Tax=Nephila pilipes TaxID=299642 RepID=A0A8X6UBA4_NEPPI|nr:hypothetical protein NPIL_623171 [Nephila pilipes]